MDINLFEEDQLNNETWDDEYSNQMIFPSPYLLGRPSPKNCLLHDDYVGVLTQTDAVDEEPNDSFHFEHYNLVQKKIHKKTRKQKKDQKKSTMNFLVKDFAFKVSDHSPQEQIQYCQQIKNLIGNLEGTLVQLKQKILSQIHEKASKQ